MEGFEDGLADGAFVVSWWGGGGAGCGEGADSVAREFGDEEGEGLFPGGEDLGFVS